MASKSKIEGNGTFLVISIIWMIWMIYSQKVQTAGLLSEQVGVVIDRSG